MATREEIIIDVEINNEDVAAKLAETTAEIQKLKKENKELDKTTKEGAKAFAENSAKIKELTDVEKIYSNQIVSINKEIKGLSSTMKAQEKQLDSLKLKYSNLTEEQKNTEGGQKLKKSIEELDAAVKKNRAEIGDHQRNVGNYPEVFNLAGTSIGRFQNMISGFADGASSAGQVAGNAFAAIKTQAIGLGKAFLTPPIGLIVVVLSAIMLAVKSLVEAFKRNDEAATRLEKAFAALAPVGEAIAWVFDKVALHISKIIEGFAKGFTAAVKLAEALHLLPKGYADAAKSAADLVQAQDDLEEAERKYTVNSANRNKQIADLQAKSLQESKYSVEQRKKFLQEAMDLEKQDMQENVKIQKQKLANLQALANKRKDTSDKTMKAIADQEAAVINAEAAEDEGNRRRISKIESFNREIEAKNKARLAEQEKTKENSLKIAQELEDAIIRITKEGVEKEIAEKRKATERKILELKKETKLTEQGIKDRDLLILKLNEEFEKEASAMREKASAETLKAEAEKELKRLNILIDGATEGTEEEYNLRLKALQKQRDMELAEVGLAEEEKEAIRAKYRNLEIDLENDKVKKKLEISKKALKDDFELRKAKVLEDEAELAKVEIMQLEAEHAALLSLDEKQKQALGLNQKQYETLVLNSEAAIRAAKAATIEKENQKSVQQIQSFAKISDSFGSLLNTMASDQEKMQDYLGAIALANIATSTASAIAGVVAAASKSCNVWLIIAEIAAGIASVTSTIMTAKKALAEGKTPKAPRFEDGGVVPGTSYTGDNVQALVNSGEMILNKEQQANLFKFLNNTPMSSGFDYNQLAKAMENIRPQVAVTEIKNVNSRVDVIENLKYI